MSSKLKRLQRKFKKNNKLRKQFYEDFALAMRDGDGVLVRLDKLISRGKRDSQSIAVLYESWRKKMRRVQSFSAALVSSIPDHEVMILSGAERDGALPEAMEYLAKSIEISGKINGAYAMALMSPAMSFVVAAGMLIAFYFNMVPAVVPQMPLSAWPALASFFYVLSFIVVEYWFVIIGLIFGVGYLLSWSKQNWTGRSRAFAERLYFLPWRSYRIRHNDTFLISLSLLMQAKTTGVDVALGVMKDHSSPWLRWHISKMIERIPLTADAPVRALDTGFFERSVMYRIEDFAERSTFELGLKKMALDNGDLAVAKAFKYAVFASVMAIVASGVFMLSFALGSMELSTAMSSYLMKSK